METPSQLDHRERKIVLFLRAERQRQGLSATALGKKVGVARATITRMDLDQFRPGLWVILKLCDGLGVTLVDCARAAECCRDETKRPPSNAPTTSNSTVRIQLAFAISKRSL